MGQKRAYVWHFYKLYRCFSFYLYPKRFKWMKLAYKPNYIREALDYSIPLLPHSVALIILAMADRYFIGFLDFDDLGIYILAMQIAAVLSIFFTSFHNAFTPWLYAQLKKKKCCCKLKDSIIYILLYIIFIFIWPSLYKFSPDIIRIMAGRPEYYYASEIMPFFNILTDTIWFYLMHVGYLFIRKKTKLLSAITFVISYFKYSSHIISNKFNWDKRSQ